MAGAFAASRIPAIREAAVGYILDPDADVCATVLAVLSDAGHDQAVSSISVERLVHMRPWLAEARRPGLDAAIRALRPKAAAPLPAARPELRAVLASMCDGAGAQSLFALVKRGQRFALRKQANDHRASLLTISPSSVKVLGKYGGTLNSLSSLYFK